MSELFSNVGLVDKDHAAKAGKFKDCDPDKFLGEIVKLGFPVKNPHTGQETLKHMWVRVTERVAKNMDADETLVGVLDNDPVLICEYQCGDEIVFGVEEIEEVYIEYSNE